MDDAAVLIRVLQWAIRPELAASVADKLIAGGGPLPETTAELPAQWVTKHLQAPVDIAAWAVAHCRDLHVQRSVAESVRTRRAVLYALARAPYLHDEVRALLEIRAQTDARLDEQLAAGRHRLPVTGLGVVDPADLVAEYVDPVVLGNADNQPGRSLLWDCYCQPEGSIRAAALLGSMLPAERRVAVREVLTRATDGPAGRSCALGVELFDEMCSSENRGWIEGLVMVVWLTGRSFTDLFTLEMVDALLESDLFELVTLQCLVDRQFVALLDRLDVIDPSRVVACVGSRVQALHLLEHCEQVKQAGGWVSDGGGDWVAHLTRFASGPTDDLLIRALAVAGPDGRVSHALGLWKDADGTSLIPTTSAEGIVRELELDQINLHEILQRLEQGGVVMHWRIALLEELAHGRVVLATAPAWLGEVLWARFEYVVQDDCLLGLDLLLGGSGSLRATAEAARRLSGAGVIRTVR